MFVLKNFKEDGVMLRDIVVQDRKKPRIIMKSFNNLWKYYLQITERALVCSDGNNLKQLSMQTVETLL